MPYKDPDKKREANKLNARKLREKDPEKYRESSRKSYRRNIQKRRDYERKRACEKYGINVGDFERLLEEQNGKCSICEVKFSPIRGDQNLRPRIDHCHDTGRVRGLLCNRCNRAIGLFGDDQSVLKRAAKYLAEDFK